MSRHALFAAIVALAFSAGAAPASQAQVGSLTQLDGRAGCLNASASRGCGRVRGLGALGSVVVSPSGGSVYVAGTDSIGVLRRGAGGALRQLRGRAGCLRRDGARGCARVRALRDVRRIELSRDGRNVYVATGATGGAVVVLARNRRTGALLQLRGSAGCVSDRTGGGCRNVRALAGPTTLALSPSGRFLYAGSSGGGIATFRRSTRTGRLVQLSGADGCVTARGLEGCARGVGISRVFDVVASRDGRILWASSRPDEGVAVFERVAGGVLRQLAGSARCISAGGAGGCRPARTLLDSSQLAESINGAHLYVAPPDRSAVAVLHRDHLNGGLFQPAGPPGCIGQAGRGLDCAVGPHVLGPAQIELSSDGYSAYLTSHPGADFESGDRILVVLSRDRTSGQLSELPGAAGCIGPTAGCTSSRGLGSAVAIALSGGGANAYVTWGRPSTLAVYRRSR